MLSDNQDWLTKIPQAISDTDYYLAISLCEQASKEDQIAWMNSRFYLGWMHEFGLGLDQNYEIAISLYVEAANEGDCRAMFRIGAYHARSRNFEAAIDWFQKAAIKGYAPAIWRLGVYHKSGRHLPKNIDLAKKFFTEAMKQGHAPAMYSYGSILLRSYNPIGLYYKIKSLVVFFSSGVGSVKTIVD